MPGCILELRPYEGGGAGGGRPSSPCTWLQPGCAQAIAEGALTTSQKCVLHAHVMPTMSKTSKEPTSSASNELLCVALGCRTMFSPAQLPQLSAPLGWCLVQHPTAALPTLQGSRHRGCQLIYFLFYIFILYIYFIYLFYIEWR